MDKEITGIIISEVAYKETSKILNVLTYEYGVVGFMARGCRSLKSPFRSSACKLILAKFNVVFRKDKLSTVKAIDVIDYFKMIRNDITLISYASFMLDLASQVIKQNNNSDIYYILIDSLNKINNGFDPMVILNIMELKYLDYLGVMPVLDCCAICGSKEGIITFNSDKGGYICKNCRTFESIKSTKAIKLLRMFYYVDIGKIEKLDISSSVKLEINSFLNQYYDKYTGLYLKSKSFLDEMVL